MELTRLRYAPVFQDPGKTLRIYAQCIRCFLSEEVSLGCVHRIGVSAGDGEYVLDIASIIEKIVQESVCRIISVKLTSKAGRIYR